MRLRYLPFVTVPFVLACATLSSPTVAGTVTPAQDITIVAPSQDSALVDIYDPTRNPTEDLKQAVAIAQNENKRIILELGGDWCIWCKHMDDFYAAHSDLLQFRAEHYVLVKVNVSEENMNETFLSQFPEAAGYPHIYILDRDGTLLHSQNTAELEDGADSYVLDVFMAFLEKWALPAR
ncbi:MAG TPA: thioredoxin family protein [Anaerolineales bacterium]|nr:thioredoxin family protein [Anaerolineales bacterium]